MEAFAVAVLAGCGAVLGDNWTEAYPLACCDPRKPASIVLLLVLFAWWAASSASMSVRP
jgi:hypothetical protein